MMLPCRNLFLTGRGISVSFVTISFLTPASLLSSSGLPFQKKEYSKSLRQPDSDNLVSHKATRQGESMLV